MSDEEIPKREKLWLFGRLRSIAESLESIAESLDVLSSCVTECNYDSGNRNEFVIRSRDVDVYIDYD